MSGFTPADLPRISDRTPYLYVEQCLLEREDGALVATDEDHRTRIPAATIGILMLGPGTTITHAAVALICKTGTTILWVGEHGVRCYAGGSALTGSTRLLERQAALVTNPRKRLAIARRMYGMRFPGENLDATSMRQLLGKEGKRVASIYRKEAERVGITWNGRRFTHSADIVNRALSSANSCLYGMVHAAITALGCSPALGFVHCHNPKSFVFDISDLYKAETTIPIAFDLHQCPATEVEGIARRMVRDRLQDGNLVERCVNDIRRLLEDPDETELDTFPTHVGMDLNHPCDIWAGGTTYGKAGTRWAP